MERRNRLKTKRKSKIDNVQIRENIRLYCKSKAREKFLKSLRSQAKIVDNLEAPPEELERPAAGRAFVF